MTIAQEEIFGPVLSVIKFSSDDEAVRIANDSIYGLASAVWSEDYDRCLEIAKKLRAGTVWINDHHLINCIAPFGGYKQSGIGRELGSYGLDEYTEVKHVHVDLTRDPERKMFGVLLVRAARVGRSPGDVSTPGVRTPSILRGNVAGGAEGDAVNDQQPKKADGSAMDTHRAEVAERNAAAKKPAASARGAGADRPASSEIERRLDEALRHQASSGLGPGGPDPGPPGVAAVRPILIVQVFLRRFGRPKSRFRPPQR